MDGMTADAGSGGACNVCGTDRVYPPLPLAHRLIVKLDRVIYRVAKRWLFLVSSVFFVHVLSLFLAPVLASAGYERAARPIYAINGLFCHQMDERSFHVFGEKMACCERCAAIYGALLLAALVYAAIRARIAKPRLTDLALLALPIAVDGGAQALGLWDSTTATRVLTGSLFGAGVAWFLMPYLDAGFARIREQIELLFSRLVESGRARPL